MSDTSFQNTNRDTDLINNKTSAWPRWGSEWWSGQVYSLSAPLVKCFALWSSYAIILLLWPHTVEGPLLSWFLVACLPVMTLSLSYRPTCGKWPVVWRRYPLGSSTKSTSSLATSRRSTTSITSMLVGGSIEHTEGVNARHLTAQQVDQSHW